MDVRRAGVGDAECISALNAEIQEIHRKALPDLFKPAEGGVFPAEQVRELMEDPDIFFWVAEEDGEAIGFCFAAIQRREENTFRYAMEMLVVEAIGVSEAARSKGVGKKLMEAAVALARERGIRRVMLDVWSFNARAHAFYEELGFHNCTERMWLEV
ncbi:MAG TPA: GNAT family N-acetyltransferase [Armatimonadota bacterium]|jgi:GNAT superfamily N-acetyltransferase